MPQSLTDETTAVIVPAVAFDLRSRLWHRGRQCLGACALAALALAGTSLALVWHGVEIVDPTSVAAAFYIGPDYNVTAAERSAMLRAPFLTPCTGLDHLNAGVYPILLLLACAAATTLGLKGHTRRHKWIAALVTIVLAPAAFIKMFLWGFLAHLFQKVGPARWVDGLVYPPLLVYVVLSWAMAIVLMIEYRRLKPKPTELQH
jgi:hypothetical protein